MLFLQKYGRITCRGNFDFIRTNKFWTRFSMNAVVSSIMVGIIVVHFFVSFSYFFALTMLQIINICFAGTDYEVGTERTDHRKAKV